jgi:hemerythrin superfamily protein
MPQLTAIDLLTEQHREVDDLFASFEDADDLDEKRDLCAQICDKLAIHALIEERHFYPAVRAARTEDILLESLEEHVQIKRAIADLLDLGDEDPGLEARMKVLKDQVTHHVEEEERELFPKVEKLFDEDRLIAIAQEMASDAADLEGTEPRLNVPRETGEAAHIE